MLWKLTNEEIDLRCWCYVVSAMREEGILVRCVCQFRHPVW